MNASRNFIDGAHEKQHGGRYSGQNIHKDKENGLEDAEKLLAMNGTWEDLYRHHGKSSGESRYLCLDRRQPGNAFLEAREAYSAL